MIAHDLGLTSSNVAAALRELDARGLITRSKDERDSRRTNLRLTPSGTTVVADNRSERVEWLARAIDAVLDEDQQALVLEAGMLLEKLSRFDGTADPSAVVTS
ncbi:MAG: marr-Family protein [Pseudonocardiales bacterium]|nr:marr-Family protein [Pseudonocardiales bacterium]